MNARAKILTRPELTCRIAEQKAKGQKIVLANGCFDVLHAGHARYLQAAKNEGDVLIVAINSDASTRKLKGAGRPVMAEADRAELVGALGAVNYVVIFDELDVRALLRELRPDVHAKGTDYTAETVPERDEAASLGIRVAIVGDPKEHSTRGLIERVRRSSHG